MPRPPSYAPGAGGARRKPSYGPLGAGVNEQAQGSGRVLDWNSVPNTKVSSASGVSGSGDWETLQRSISHIVEETADMVEDEAQICADCETGVGENSWSWEEAQAHAAFGGFNSAANYDSSYDSSSSMCGEQGQGFAEAMEQAFVQKAEGEAEKGGLPGMKGEATREVGPAGLEFASGVHLIEEMENQVKQWEETELSRDVAYNSWVQHNMMRAANMGGAMH